MRGTRIKIAFILVIMLVVLVGCGESTGGGLSNIEFATLSEGSAWYVYGATMSEVIRSNVDGIDSVDVLPYSGGVGNVEMISTGEADLGFTFSVLNKWAADGNVAFDEVYDNLRVLVGGLDQYYVGIIMHNNFIEEHSISSIADLKDNEIPVNLMTVNVGSQGEFAARQVLEAYGLTYEDLKSYGGTVEHTSFDVVQSAFQDGQADMFIQVMTKGHPGFTEIALHSPVTFMSIEDEYAQILIDYGNDKVTFPAGIFEGQDHEVDTVGFNTTLVTTDDFPEDLAYEITKSLIENKEDLVQGHQGLADFDPEEGIQPELTGGIDIHPGALKYYEEQGWK